MALKLLLMKNIDFLSYVDKLNRERLAMETAFDFDSYRRLNVRKNYFKEVSFSIDSIILPATVKNVSTGGALISTIKIPKIKIGKEILIVIPFAKKSGCIKKKARVRWVEKDRFGIEFI